jgi:putative ribosome biogenesis GTPase RsgA
MLNVGDRVITSLNNAEGMVLSIDPDREDFERVEVRTDLGVLYFAEGWLQKV